MPETTEPTPSGEKARAKLKYLAYRMDYLPTQLENTYRKLDALETEARRYGMDHLIRKRPGETQ